MTLSKRRKIVGVIFLAMMGYFMSLIGQVLDLRHAQLQVEKPVSNLTKSATDMKEVTTR